MQDKNDLPLLPLWRGSHIYIENASLTMMHKWNPVCMSPYLLNAWISVQSILSLNRFA
jgi:hypothetical protein